MKKPMSEGLRNKVIHIAVEILEMHGSVAGGRTCQDWSGGQKDPNNPENFFTADELDVLSYNYELENSDLRDYEEGRSGMGDEMVASFVVATALKNMANK